MITGRTIDLFPFTSSNVATRFGLPLKPSVISGYAQALKSKILGDVTPEQEEALAKILRQSDNLLYILNGILGLARIEAGEVSLRSEEIPFSDYFQDLRMKYVIPLEKPVSLQWSIASDPPTIQSDKVKLTIILQNLINNAIKFTEKGTVRVSARQAADKKAVEFEIADTGIGIPREAIPIIFEKFRQADSSSTRTYGGVGLGPIGFLDSAAACGVSFKRIETP